MKSQAETLLAEANEYRAKGYETGDPLHHAVADLAVLRISLLGRAALKQVEEALSEDEPIAYSPVGMTLDAPFEFCAAVVVDDDEYSRAWSATMARDIPESWAGNEGLYNRRMARLSRGRAMVGT